MKILKTFYELLTPQERRNLYLLFGAMMVMASLEVVSVASVMPFLSVAADPGSVHENTYLAWAFETFEFEEKNNFLLALGGVTLVALLVSNAFIVLTTWALYRYAWQRNHSLSRRLLRSYLHRPYEYFLTRNSSEMGKNILDEVTQVITGMLRPALRGIAKGIVSLFIIGFLIFMDPMVALGITLVLGISYAGVYISVSDRIDVYGEKRVESNTQRYQTVNEAFGGIKEVKLWGKEEEFVKEYDGPSRRFARYQTLYRIIMKTPRYFLEAIAFGGIVLIAMYLISVRDNIQQVIPMLGLYAFAGYRLMPALQQAYSGLASAQYNAVALQELHRGMRNHSEISVRLNQTGDQELESEAFSLEHRLVLDGVYFTYPGADEPAIRNLTFEVPADSTVGFVGETGSGKTTTVDLILGLLRPQRGVLSVDGTPLCDENIRGWQRDIGYVPQQIYLSDDTVARNIAFGVPEDEIDMDVVKDVARRAHIYAFVKNELPERWSTTVGERGVKLSGGQRQRIGIARALYHDPSVLVFDEATSALDQATEARVMDAIYDLEGNHTMLMIAHRLSTVQRADKIIMLENGKKVGEGTYEKLSQEHSEFRTMALS